MRVAFVVVVSFFSVLAALCLVKTVTVLSDQPMTIRWLCAALACAFIAIFWEATRRRYVMRGSLRADPALAVLAGCAVAVLMLTMIVFAVTS